MLSLACFSTKPLLLLLLLLTLPASYLPALLLSTRFISATETSVSCVRGENGSLSVVERKKLANNALEVPNQAGLA